MIEQAATVRNSAGIHCRPSTVIVQHARDYDGTVCVRHGPKESNLRSVTSLLMLELQKGASVTICVDGQAEVALCAELVSLFETHFDFPLESG